MSADERRFSREEFALVLRRAAELQQAEEREDIAAEVAPEGMTLAEMQAVARDVGVDPARVADAALLLPTRHEGALTRYIGGPSRYRLERSVPGALPARATGKVLEAIRRAADDTGAAHEIHGAIEWRHSNDSARLNVHITPHEDRTNIVVAADRSAEVFLVFFLTFLPFLLSTPILIAALGLGSAGGFGLFAGLVVVWQLCASALVRRSGVIGRARAELVLARAAEVISRERVTPELEPGAPEP